MKRAGESGQVVAGVLAVLAVALVLVPLMVFFVLNESRWTAKQAESTKAFHLAEAGTEKGYLVLTQSSQTWVSLMKGGAAASIAGYHFDKEYADVSGGSYKISITSGPQAGQATLIAAGYDNLRKEVRGIKAVYSNAQMSDNAIFGVTGVNIGGKVQVEWGSILSPNRITPLYASDNTKTWPQLWSAGSITGLDSDPNPPNCDGPDCCWWHAYQADLPASPVIDLNYYASQAKAASAAKFNCPTASNDTNNAPSNCDSGLPDCCYYQGPTTFKGANITGGATVYVNGDLQIDSSGGGSYVEGSLLVMGNFTASSGNFGAGPNKFQLKMPPNAWKQYCEPTYAWPHYLDAFDANAPASFPGLNSKGYSSPAMCSDLTKCQSSQVFSNGLLYVQGYVSATGGGGGTDFYGVMYVLGQSTMTDSSDKSTFYYNADAAKGLQLTKIMLYRESWNEVVLKKFP
jgi:hypothetical protein